MNAIKKFESKVLDLSVDAYLDSKQNIWFRGKDVALALGYKDTDQAIRSHVDTEDKNTYPVKMTGQVRNVTFISEPGLYSLIFNSKLELAKAFKRWVFIEVLPSIRESGQYKMTQHRQFKQLTFKIETENDLHTKVVNFMRNQYPDSLFVATLGENQDTPSKRLNSYRLGYLKGSPDLIIQNLHKHFNGFAIEFKSPTGKGVLSKPNPR